MKYPPIGKCIYCGSTTGKLGDEHIIPFSLNGDLILQDASCRSCETITHRYERIVAREIYGNFRMQQNVKTRHPEKRPTHISIGTILPDGTHGTKQIPVTEYPAPFFIYKFFEATILLGLPPEIEDFKWEPIVIFGKQETDDFIKKHHWDRKTSFRAVPVEFARMLAKIAYSYTVAEIGLGSFQPAPLILDVIMSRTTNVSYVVGGEEKLPLPDPRGVHLLQMICEGDHKEALIIINIRLFPAFETPSYYVVVGKFDFKQPEHVNAFNEKMRHAETIEPLPPKPIVPQDTTR